MLQNSVPKNKTKYQNNTIIFSTEQQCKEASSSCINSENLTLLQSEQASDPKPPLKLVMTGEFTLSNLVDRISRKLMTTLPKIDAIRQVYNFLSKQRDIELLTSINNALYLIYYYPVQGRDELVLSVYSRSSLHTSLYEAINNVQIQGKDHTKRIFEAYTALLKTKILLLLRLPEEGTKELNYTSSMNAILHYINLHLATFEKVFTIIFNIVNNNFSNNDNNSQQSQNLNSLFDSIKKIKSSREYVNYHEFKHLNIETTVPLQQTRIPAAITDSAHSFEPLTPNDSDTSSKTCATPPAATDGSIPRRTPKTPEKNKITAITHYDTPNNGQTPQKSSPQTEATAQFINACSKQTYNNPKIKKPTSKKSLF